MSSHKTFFHNLLYTILSIHHPIDNFRRLFNSKSNFAFASSLVTHWK